ncbi:F-box/kelch-repeat protein [Cardamine amara subsp. amara]|uniref:F-box/kelch-repeat protein n=1 Tax=Cardamine amara subsp. amara TaxID=228776 RepID=A0ABD1AKW0_CARAN
MEGNIFLNFNLAIGGAAFKANDLIWEVIELHTDLDSSSTCIIGNITYSYDREFRCREYTTRGAVWRRLMGLEYLSLLSTVKLVDYDGKLVVLWDKYVIGS